jgi:hypothetical protein
MLETYDRAAFEEAVHKAAREAIGDGRVILGIADRVPANVDQGRLEALPALIREAWMTS